MIQNIGIMEPCGRMPSMSMSSGALSSVPLSEVSTNNPRPPPGAAVGNAKKKRRTNAKTSRSQSLPCPVTQDLHVENQLGFPRPPQSSGFGDTVVASNPFDDTPPARAPSSGIMGHSMHIHSPHLHHHHHHHHQQQPMGVQPMRAMNPMAELRPMMAHNMGMNGPRNPLSPMGMSNQSSMMGVLSNPMRRMSPINNMGSNQRSPINMLNNPMSCEGPIANMGIHTMPMNNRDGPMNNIRSTQPMNIINPMSNAGNPSQGINPAMMMSHMGNPMNGRQLCARPIGSGNISGNQGHLENPMNMGRMGMSDNYLNGPQTINNFGCNASQTYSNNMGMQINPGNMGLNTNMAGMNIMPNDSNPVERIQMGNIGPAIPIGHPIDMGPGSLTNQELQGRNGMATRLVAPSNEKIYPADQQMIFNTQNRNAPPIYVCGSCHKEVHDNDQGIVCESGCNFWFHRSCVGLSEAAFQMLTQAPYAEWACDKCSRGKKIPPVKFTS